MKQRNLRSVSVSLLAWRKFIFPPALLLNGRNQCGDANGATGTPVSSHLRNPFTGVHRLVRSIMHTPARRIFIEQSILGIVLYRLRTRMGLSALPPHILKQRIVKEYADRYSVRTLVETGTYLGDMVAAVRRKFSKIVSIELDVDLWKIAREKFARYEHISILQGDSSTILPGVVASIPEPCLFWLDAHYSGGTTARGETETPIIKELHTVLDRKIPGDIILVDDARLFVGKDDYPTIAQVRNLVAETRPDMFLESKDDIIRIRRTGLR